MAQKRLVSSFYCGKRFTQIGRTGHSVTLTGALKRAIQRLHEEKLIQSVDIVNQKGKVLASIYKASNKTIRLELA